MWVWVWGGGMGLKVRGLRHRVKGLGVWGLVSRV